MDLDRRADAFAVPVEHVAHSNPYRAYVTAIEGCNHVYSFCVVPRTRGPEACRPADDIVAEVRSLVARGVPEVMLLGQTVNAYRHGGLDFADLLARVEDEVPGLVRLRFTTSHPSHMTADMARRLGRLRRLCPYIHLPVQSGSDAVLESMRRAGVRAQTADPAPATATTTITDHRADGKLRVRNIEISDLGHAWTGGPGGHPYCERRGAPLTALCGQFLRDVGMIRNSFTR